jgi:hypothetical protein
MSVRPSIVYHLCLQVHPLNHTNTLAGTHRVQLFSKEFAGQERHADTRNYACMQQNTFQQAGTARAEVHAEIHATQASTAEHHLPKNPQHCAHARVVVKQRPAGLPGAWLQLLQYIVACGSITGHAHTVHKRGQCKAGRRQSTTVQS